MAEITIRVQTAPFDAGALTLSVSGDPACGAVASFLGQVRSDDAVTTLELEHFPGVTEKALDRIAREAATRWSLGAALIVHRIGPMTPGEPIVFVAASAPHRRAALDAVSFMIDVLKTQAPFWKKAHTSEGSSWIEARQDDDAAAARWLTGE